MVSYGVGVTLAQYVREEWEWAKGYYGENFLTERGVENLASCLESHLQCAAADAFEGDLITALAKHIDYRATAVELIERYID